MKIAKLTSATNPESGTVTYAYDNDGNLSSKIDARNVSTYFLYDALHRLKERGHNDGTPTAYFYYDWAEWWFHTNVIGRLTHAVTSDSGWYEYGYDAMGRLKTEYQLLSLPVTYDYNLDGSLKSVTYPSGTQITYTPNAAGRVTQVSSNLADATHPGTLASGIQYHPHGAMKQMTLGNGLVEVNTYNNRLQPSQMRTNNPATGTDLLNMVYSFNLGTANNGNVMAWSATGQQTFSRTYTYDELNRIKTMAGTGGTCTGLSWSYDVWGNRTAQTTTGGSCPSPSFVVNAQNQMVISGYTYDAAGNLAAEPGKTYQYDAENRLKSINSGSVASYVYDASGRRVKKSAAGADTLYFYDSSGNAVAEYNTGGVWQTAYVYLNGQLLAQYSGGASGTTYLVHKDHLGSTRLLTKLDRTVQECTDYLPFGETYACGGTTTTSHKFTGHERDAESGLDYMKARHYAYSMGRFISPDPLLASGSLNDPQSWNRYSYVVNKPLRYVDPFGLYTWSATAGGSATDKELETRSNDKHLTKKERAQARSALQFRQEFRAALAQAAAIANSPSVGAIQGQAIQHAVNAYGKEGDPGVTVGIRIGKDYGATSVLNEDDTVAVAFGKDVTGNDLTVAVAHEGIHVADAQFWAANHCTGCTTDLRMSERETRAWFVGSYVAEALGMGHLRPHGAGPEYDVWNKGWKGADRETFRNAGVEKVVRDLYPDTRLNDTRYSQEHKHRP